MPKIIYLIVLFLFVSCDGLLQFGDSESVPAYEISNRPQIYLSQKEQYMDIAEINRKNIALNLSDRIVFSNKKRSLSGEDLLEPTRWLALKDFNPEDDLKVKISSFCSYEKKNSSPEPGRVHQEIAAGTYQWSFTIFDLLPKEMLLSDSDKSFFCSFIFAFKNETGNFNHFNMPQQIIEPLSSAYRANKLSLRKRTNFNNYVPVDGTIQRKDIDKILLFNNTGKPVKNYHLFCGGLKTAVISDFQIGPAPVFPVLLNNPALDQMEGLKNCRFVSEDDKKIITGITNSFKLDFSQLNKKREAIDLQKIKWLVIATKMSKERKSWRTKNGEIIPIHSYFYFKNMDKRDFNNKHSIDITVKTSCINKSAFGRGEVLSKTYTFPFRLRFPVMAVTPRLAFAMNSISEGVWRRKIKKFKKDGQFTLSSSRKKEKYKDKYRSTCIYRITLSHRYKPEINKSFKDRIYFLVWAPDSYGIDYIPMEQSEEISRTDVKVSSSSLGINHISVKESKGDIKTDLSAYGVNHVSVKQSNEVSRSRPPDPMAYYVNKDENKNHRHLRGKFARLDEIYENRAGYLKFNFFDVLHDPFLWRENYPIDRMVLECHSQRRKIANSVSASWPNNIPNDSVALKTLFSHSDIKAFIEKNTLALCRFFLYEDKLLRYFSREMKIAK